MSMQRSSSLSELRHSAFSSKKLARMLSPPKISSLSRIILSLTAISGVTVLNSFLGGALTVALPSIAKSIGLSQELLSWPLSMFSLVSGALLLIAGAMADAFGRRRVFLLGVAVFAAVSIATSFMQSGTGLIGCCAGLGLAAAMLIPAGVGILGSSIPEGPIKNRSFALIGAAQPIGFILGLILGGLLANNWRIIFWILGAFAIGLGACAYVSLPNEGEELIPTAANSRATSVLHLPTNAATVSVEGRASTTSVPHNLDELAASAGSAHGGSDSTSRSMRLKTFDWFGAFMSTSGLVMLTFALADAESAPHGWKTSYVLALLPTSVALLAAFISWERYLERRQRTYETGASVAATKHQTRNATFFKAAAHHAVAAAGHLASAALWCGTAGHLPRLAVVQRDVVPQHSGVSGSAACFGHQDLALLPSHGRHGSGAQRAGWCCRRKGPRRLAYCGGATAGAAACLILSVAVEPSTPYYKAMLYVLILQVGPDVSSPRALCTAPSPLDVSTRHSRDRFSTPQSV